MNKLRFNKTLIILALLLVANSLLLADIDKNAGKYGFQFLKIPVSPELSAMANTGEILHSSPLNIKHHPAAFAWNRGASVAFSQTSWLVDTHLYNLAWRNIAFNKAFGLALTYMDHGKFDKRTENGTLIGHYYPLDINVAANYAMKVSPDMHAGINVHLIYEKIDSSSALAFSSDLGFVYLTPFRNTSIDAVVKNIGKSTKMDEERIDLPVIAELGFTTGLDVNELIKLFPSGKLVYMKDHDDILPAVGVSAEIFEMLFIRAGYKFNYNEEDFSAGFGIHYKNIKIDYSFMNNLDSIHSFGIGWNF